MRSPWPIERVILGSLACLSAQAAAPQPAAAPAGRRVLAVFAHPDDERVVGPLLARLARDGHEVHLVIATDGSKGVRDHAGIPAGPPLAAARAREAECAARRLGVRRLHMLGLEDGGLGKSAATLAELRTNLSAIMASVRPEVIVTFGPEGGTGHPDHRLVGNVTTEIVQGDPRHRTAHLFYASLPEERLQAAPPSAPRVSGVAEALLTVRVPVEARDIVAGRESFACHADPIYAGGNGRDQRHAGARLERLRLPAPLERPAAQPAPAVPALRSSASAHCGPSASGHDSPLAAQSRREFMTSISGAVTIRHAKVCRSSPWCSALTGMC